MNNDSLPEYQIRGIRLKGFRDLEHCLDYLYADGPLKEGALVAINAEKVITAEQDGLLRDLISQAEYNYADGISLVLGIRRKYPDAEVQRVAGADLWQALMQRAARQKTPVFLVGGKADVLAETIQKLQQWGVDIVGYQDGYFGDAQALFEKIKQSGAALVTVAMGSPKQELLIRECRRIHPHALYMGVGGTYDVFTGRVKRAPLLWQKWGLEWLYRLLSQPTRFARQWKLLRYLGYYYSNRL